MENLQRLPPLMTGASDLGDELLFRSKNMTESTPPKRAYPPNTPSFEEEPQPLQRKFKSARLVGQYEKPWLQDYSYRRREQADKVILCVCSLTGFGIAALICLTQWNQLPVHDYCLILDDNFETINNSTWTREVGVGGFGYGSFDWTTDDPANSYVSISGLHIVPTLTVQSTDITPDQIYDGYVVNLTADGSCTSPDVSQCVRHSNSSNGTVINPVRSARLTTAGKASIKYGRVEIVAKMPKGDWLWPSIWMYPEKETYGSWPRSGEIDIALIRGNEAASYAGGLDTVSSAMHWGESVYLDQSDRTSGKLTLRRQDLSTGFHTYGIEWSETYLFTWIDDRVYQILSTGFGPSWGGTMYQRAGYADMWMSGGLPPNIWGSTTAFNTPFDQPFHLIINVAVGASNGIFPDGEGNKPWIDGSKTAMRDFWRANSSWLSTWGSGENCGMTVKSVKMWQQGRC